MPNHRILPVLSAALLLAVSCSKSDKKSVPDAGPVSPDAAVAKDTRPPDAPKVLDTGKSPDGAVADTARDTLEAGARDVAADVRDALTDARDALPDGKIADALEVASLGDSAADTVGDTNRDGAKQDGPKPTDAVVEAGADVPVVGLGTCQSPIDLPYDLNMAEIEVDTTGAGHAADIPCATNGATLVFRIKVDTRRKLYYAHTFGADWNTALMFSDSCTAPKMPSGQEATACSDDACGTPQSAVSALLSYGYRYLFLTGVGEASGKVKLHFEQAMVGTGTVLPMPEGAGTVEGTLAGLETVAWCEAVGPKQAFWWAGCPAYAGGTFNATTCNGTTVDTVLSLQVPRAETAMCMDDDIACGSQSTIGSPIPAGAGLNVLTVMGSLGTSVGDYTLTYSRP